MVLLSEVVATSAALTATRSRKAKTQALAALLVATSDPDELGVVVGFLTGEPRQGRFGIGWSSLAALDAPAAAVPELTVRAVDEALSDIAGTTGAGSAGPCSARCSPAPAATSNVSWSPCSPVSCAKARWKGSCSMR